MIDETDEGRCGVDERRGASRGGGMEQLMARRCVGVVGAGTMGVGVAYALAEAGHSVVLVDVSAERLARAMETIGHNARMYRLFGGKAVTRNVLASIRPVLEHDQLREAAFVIENITERWELKRELYVQLDRICAPDVAFAVNTSAIPITRVASCTRRPDRVVGMHFMNPVPLMSTVEVVRGTDTSDATIAEAKALLASMGKDAIVVRDSPGFVTNRVMMLVVNEATALLQDEVSSVEDIDRLFKTCFGHKMGPFETADLIGLDTVMYSLEVLYDHLHDVRFQPAPLLRTLVEEGRLGRKSGRGFYAYEDRDEQPTQPREAMG